MKFLSNKIQTVSMQIENSKTHTAVQQLHLLKVTKKKNQNCSCVAVT